MFLLLPLTSFGQVDYYFPPVSGDEWDTYSFEDVGWCDDQLPALLNYLDEQATKAFIVTVDGKIVIEEYFGTFTADSVWLWNSAGKSLTSVLVGIAEQESLLNLDDPASDYLGQGWTSCSSEDEDLITIRHQLMMTSGLDDGVEDPYCTDPACLTCIAVPGERWAYHNGPYTNLDGVISAATGMSLNMWVFNRITQPTGITGVFFPFGYNNVFISKPRSLARFGSLALNQGNWNGTQIVNSTYAQTMVQPSQNLNESYGYLWWLNGQDSFMLPGTQFVFNGSAMPNVPDDAYAALGKDGQILLVVPSMNLTMVRMGTFADNSLLISNILANNIWPYLEALMCVNVDESATPNIYVAPNPSHGQFTIAGVTGNPKTTVFDMAGRKVHEGAGTQLSLDHLQAGIYFLHVEGSMLRIVIE